MRSANMFALFLISAFVWASAAHSVLADEGGREKTVVSGKVVALTTGINPDHYPCAKEHILKLYEHRQEIEGLKAYHPRRIWVWLQDNLSYYSIKVIDFFRGLFTKQALNEGIHNIQSLARNGIGNPFSNLDDKLEGWAKNLSPSSQMALKQRVEGIVRATTRQDGSCK